MIGFNISILVISEKIPEYTDQDLQIQYYPEVKCPIRLITYDKVSSYRHLLSILNEFKTIDHIVTTKNTDKNTIDILTNASVEFTKRWCHYDNEPDIKAIVSSAVNTIRYNLNRNITNILFSIYTPTFNTPKDMLDRVYNSLYAQNYQHWNWYVLDDSPNNDVCDILKSYNDPRIFVVKNISNHGNIGYNKHTIAMMCSGDWLIEVDHDDELTSNCLITLYNAIQKYPNSKFIYSDAVEESMKYGKMYGEEYEFCHYLGKYKTENVNGQTYCAAYVGELNPIAIRSILAAPNHIRCFRKDFYHEIGGHSTDMSILDDMELMSRAFLYINSIDEITYVGNILYLQHNESTTARSHINITLTFNHMLVIEKYDRLIHEKLLSMGFEDPTWSEQFGYTFFDKETINRVRSKLPVLCNVYVQQ